jgi:aldose 1-epimerase
MRETGRRRRLLRPVVIGLSAVVALAVGGSLAASQALAANATGARPAAGFGTLSVTKALFGETVEPYTGKETDVYRYTLTNADGMSVDILTYGGIIQEINVPNLYGQVSDVVLGFGTLQDYVTYDSPPVTANGGPYFGEILGRYANRIANGTFALNQPGIGPITYTLPANDGANSLNGGLVGFGNHVWADQPIQTSTEVGVQLTLVSPNGDEAAAAGSPGCPDGCTGYPGEVKVVVTYTLNNQNQLAVQYAATDESPNLDTVVNLTNNSYFNLSGEDSPALSAYDQLVQINADHYTPTNGAQIPLGTIAPVAGTRFDFTRPRPAGSPAGYDDNWVLNPETPATRGPDGLNLAARAWDLTSGRELTVWTDQPGVQFSTGTFTGSLAGVIGSTNPQVFGYTLDTQHFPDSPNHPSFPSTELDAGKTFVSTTVYQFSLPSLF